MIEGLVITALAALVGAIVGSWLGYRIGSWLFGTPEEWFDPTSKHYQGTKR